MSQGIASSLRAAAVAAVAALDARPVIRVTALAFVEHGDMIYGPGHEFDVDSATASQLVELWRRRLVMGATPADTLRLHALSLSVKRETPIVVF